MNILVAVDSFKGTMSSLEIAKLVLKNYQSKERHNFYLLGISDGGEGFLDAIGCMIKAKKVDLTVEGPLGESINTSYLIKNKTAYIELAKSSGLSLLKEKDRNPFLTSTHGLGQTIKHTLERDINRIVIGIGGSSTNDGGSGLLKALGVKFFDDNGNEIPRMTGSSIGKIKHIDLSQLKSDLLNKEIIVACDVRNPLLGKKGATHTYAKQKGADQDMIHMLERNMNHYHKVVQAETGLDFSHSPGAGAAGGVGYALKTFLKADMFSGLELISNLLGLEDMIKKIDLVITGEGCLDEQTMEGKAPFRIAKIAKENDKLVYGIFGQMTINEKPWVFDKVFSIVPKYARLEESISHPKKSLIKCLKDI